MAARGKALVGALRARPDTRNAAALAVWCGRYKGVRQKLKAIEPSTSAIKGIQGALNLPEERRDKKLTEIGKFGGPAQKGLAKQARDNPQLMKTALNREMKAREKAAKLAALKANTNSEPTVPDNAPSTKLPDIDSGTDKQNAFAKDVRKRFQKTLQDQVDEIKKANPDKYGDLTVDKWLNSGASGTAELRKILANDDPKFWIDKVRGNERSRAGLQNLIARG